MFFAINRALSVVTHFSKFSTLAIIVGFYLAALPSYSFADLIKTAPIKGYGDTSFLSTDPSAVVARYCPEHGGEISNLEPERSVSFICYHEFDGELHLSSDWRDVRGRSYAEVCDQGWGEQYVYDADGLRTNKVEFCWKADTSHVPRRPEMCSANAKADTIGNPIVVASRRKVQSEVDYLGVGNYPLKFERIYSSGQNGVYGAIPAITEYKTWRHNYDKVLAGDLQPGTPEANSTTLFARGRPIPAPIAFGGEPGGDFNARRADGSIIRIVDFASASNRKTTLTPSTTPQGLQGFKLTLPSNDLEFYDVLGRLVATQSRAGETHTLSYVEGKLDRVEDDYGKALTFEYVDEALTALIDPAVIESNTKPTSTVTLHRRPIPIRMRVR